MLNAGHWGMFVFWVVGVTALVGCGGSGTTGGAPNSAGTSGGAEIVEVAGLDDLKGTVAIDGSSTVFPVTEAVAEEFQSATQHKVHVTVGISGTGGGFKKFARGETDISDASRPILKEEIEACQAGGIEFIELPVCFDALTVVVNPKNDWLDAISIDDLKKMWGPQAEGKVKKWSDVNPAWPQEDLLLYGPGTDSGTFDYFTEAVVGKAKSSRSDFTPSEDDNTLVQGVEGSRYALGYFGYAYYEPNKKRLKALKIIAPGKSEGVAPSAASVLSGAYTPLSRPLFIYVSAKSAKRPEVNKFAEFYLRHAPVLATDVKYVPLPASAYDKALARLSNQERGTAFGGVPEVGVPIDELLNRPVK